MAQMCQVLKSDWQNAISPLVKLSCLWSLKHPQFLILHLRSPALPHILLHAAGHEAKSKHVKTPQIVGSLNWSHQKSQFSKFLSAGVI